MRLHLIGLLGLGPSPCLLPSALAHHVETLSSPTKHTVQDLPLRTHRWAGSCLTVRIRVSQINNMFRWRCRESNPGPQRLHLEGVTTISLLYCTGIYWSTKQTIGPTP